MQKFYRVCKSCKETNLPHYPGMMGWKGSHMAHPWHSPAGTASNVSIVLCYILVVIAAELCDFLNSMLNKQQRPRSAGEGGWGSFLMMEQTQGILLRVAHSSDFWVTSASLALRKCFTFPGNKKWISSARGGEGRDSSCSGNILVLRSCRHKSRSFPGRNAAHLTWSLAKIQFKNETISPFPTENSPTFPVSPRAGFWLILLLHLVFTSKISNLPFFLPLFYWWDFLLPLGICVASRHCKLICVNTTAGKTKTNYGNNG